MRIWPLFLRTSGSSGVLKALLLEKNRQLSCNPKKKKKKNSNAMPAEDILNEPLFFNQQISVPLGSSATGSADDSTTSGPLTPHDQPSMLAAGITKVAHLQVALKQQ